MLFTKLFHCRFVLCNLFSSFSSMFLQNNLNLRLLSGLLAVGSVLDFSFHFVILNLLKFVCTKFHHMLIGRPLSRLPWGLLFNNWLTSLLLSFLSPWPIPFNQLLLTNYMYLISKHLRYFCIISHCSAGRYLNTHARIYSPCALTYTHTYAVLCSLATLHTSRASLSPPGVTLYQTLTRTLHRQLGQRSHAQEFES
jgi:hypothetical protein